jgi:hypothetical protein
MINTGIMRAGLVTAVGVVIRLSLGALFLPSTAFCNSDRPKTANLSPDPCVAMSSSGWTAEGGFSPSSMEFPVEALTKKNSYWPDEVPVITAQVDVTDSSGQSLSHSIALGAMPESCRVAFSNDGKYLAMGLRLHLGAQEWLSISTFDSQTNNWMQTFDVKAGPNFTGPFQLEGFLQSSYTLVVSGVGSPDATTKNQKIFTLLFGVDGSKVEPHVSNRIAGPGMEYGIVDAGNNRLWIRGGPGGYCPLRSVTLTEPFAEGPKIDSSISDGLFCNSPLDAVGFVSSNIIVGESVRQNAKQATQSWVWIVNLDSGTGDKVELPKPGYSLFTAWRDIQVRQRVSVSTDGAVFAVGRSITKWAFDEPWPSPAEIAVVQVNPLRVLEIVRQKSCSTLGAFAIEHRNGNTTVLAYWCGKLQRTVITDPK